MNAVAHLKEFGQTLAFGLLFLLSVFAGTAALIAAIYVGVESWNPWVAAASAFGLVFSFLLAHILAKLMSFSLYGHLPK